MERAIFQHGCGLGMGGGDGETAERTQQQTECSGAVGGKSTAGVQAHHFMADRVDDPFSPQGGAQGHCEGAQNHKPHGDQKGLGIPASLGQRHAQKKNAHELLSVLSAVKKGHGRGSPCLSSAVKGRAPAAVPDGGKAAEPPQEKAENHGYDKAQDDPKPGIALHVGQAAGPGGGGAGDTGHQRVALTGGDAEDPCGGGPEDNSAESSAQRTECSADVSTKVGDGIDAFGNRCVEGGHHGHPQKIAQCGQPDGSVERKRSGGDGGGDGVGRIGPSVDQDDAQGQKHHTLQSRVGELGEKRAE